MYSNILIERLRGIKKLVINELKQINIFVGKNNCGKTTILEGLFLLSGPTNPLLLNNINIFRGSKTDLIDWMVLFNDFDINNEIKIKGDLSKPKEMRNLRIKPSLESIKMNQTNEIKNTNTSNFIYGLDLILLFKGQDHSEIKEFKTNISHETNQLNNEYKFKLENKYKNSLKCTFLTSKMKLDDINKKLENIIKNKRKDEIIKILKKIDPKISDIQFIGNQIYFDTGLTSLVPIFVLGEGLIKILFIIISIFEFQDGVVLIDEIENGLYPISQEILWEAIFASAKEFNVQLFITTHSIECLTSLCNTYEKQAVKKDFFRLFRIEKKEEEMIAVDYSYELLKESLISGWEIR